MLTQPSILVHPVTSRQSKATLAWGASILAAMLSVGPVGAADAPASASLGQGSGFPEIAGWTRSTEISTYTPATLYEYIDGAAEAFLSFDFQELRTAEYTGKNKSSVVVEMYRHPSPVLAFGIYSQEKPTDGTFLDVGAQGYIGLPTLNFLIGDTYVKLAAYQLGDEADGVLRQFAQKTAEAIGGSTALPPEISCFPHEGKRPHSERFAAHGFLGYEFLHSGFTADYTDGGTSFQLFLIKGRDAGDCREMLTRYLQNAKQPRAELEEGLYTIADPNYGDVALAWKGRYIWGAISLSDPAKRRDCLAKMETRLSGLD